MRKKRTLRNWSEDERRFVEAMAGDAALDQRARRRALAVLTFMDSEDGNAAASASGLSAGSVAKAIELFNEGSWQALITVQAPRGGDFLSRYDHGYWAERLARACLDNTRDHRAVPYGTSKSEPFTDLKTFRDFSVNEFLLQAWSVGGKWKRPDLLMPPRRLLSGLGGNDEWTPDLQHWDNQRCSEFVKEAHAAIEVETSLWQVRKATVPLSFTVKDEDLDALRAWVRANKVQLFILQVFYDEAHILPFETLEFLITGPAPTKRRVLPEIDRFTRKSTYMVPLGEGFMLGRIPEPDVEGRVFKAPNGRVTVYGHLVGSSIQVEDPELLSRLTQVGRKWI